MNLIHTTPITHKVQSKPVLTAPAMAVSAGEHTLILGNSGSGKTTLLSLLAGLQTPTQGEVSIAGKTLKTLSHFELDQFRGRTIGIIFQQLHLIDALTARQNVALAGAMAKVTVEEAYIADLFKELGLQGLEKRKPRQLSHGQAQRVAIARALANKPKLILADEPTSALDDTHTEQVVTRLLKQAETHHATLVIATHDQRLKEHFKKHMVRLEAQA